MSTLIFDTETTSLIQNHTIKLISQPEIIEFYGRRVDLDKGEIISDLWHLFRPKTPIGEETTKITHLTNADLRDKPVFRFAAGDIKRYIEGSDLVIAHNASFDMEMVDIEFERIGQKIEWPPVMCTVEQTMHIKGFRLSLTGLHEFLFNEPFADAHRAKIDTEALCRCCFELRKRGMI